MSLIIIFSILLIHWFADFVVQTPKQSENKSKSMFYLLEHTMTYSLYWMFAGFIYLIINTPLPALNDDSWNLTLKVLQFGGITFICHTITDYFTSRLNAKLWNKVSYYMDEDMCRALGRSYCKGERQKYAHNFFVSIGFDQLLHYVQLFLTFYLLTK